MTRSTRILTVLAALAAACGGGSKAARMGGVAPTTSMAESADSAAGAPEPAIAAAGVAAGEWDDNANYREFRKLIAGAHGIHELDIRDRQFLVVRDQSGKPVPSCRLDIGRGSGDHVLVRLTTLSNGRAILFPHTAGIEQPDVHVTATCGDVTFSQRARLSEDEGVIELSLPGDRVLPARPALDIAFVLDTTGSMSEEIAGVKATISAVAGQLDSLGADIRVGLVEYKDRTDAFVTRVYPFSSDIRAFGQLVSGLSAQGGGDMPEDVNEGLEVAVTQLSWNPEAAARLVFLVGDAPPHLDYAQDVSYTASARHAARQGLQVHTIAASGMDRRGQLIWRQIAQFTGGTNMFVLRGGAGPQSSGAGDPVSSCGGTQKTYSSGNLDGLVLDKIGSAIAALDADPMAIPGLGQDERAKPCDERIIAR